MGVRVPLFLFQAHETLLKSARMEQPKLSDREKRL